MSTTGTIPHPETLQMEYLEVCKSHGAVTEFRAKLLALLPIASGSGLFILLAKRAEPLDTAHLPVIGIFGLLITLGLFFYELRGIQHCKHLIHRARQLEGQLGLSHGQFTSAPKGRLGGLVGAEGAAWIIYPAMLAAWVYVAFVGFSASSATRSSAHAPETKHEQRQR